MQAVGAAWLVVMLSLPAAAHDSSSDKRDVRESPVGMPARIDQLVLPGGELEVKPLSGSDSPIVLRVAGVFPHGTATRYDLVYYGLEPGEFDLRDYLQRKEGGSTADLPPLAVTIRPSLPPGQIEPNELESRSLPALGGYQLLLLVGGVLWVLGLLAILFVGRRKKHAARRAIQPASLADRLRPLVEQAMAGNLPHARLAELERALLALWRRRLALEDIKAADAIITLREHEEAGALLRQLELWLHHPADNDEVNVAALLEPYKRLPPDALALHSDAAGGVA